MHAQKLFTKVTGLEDSVTAKVKLFGKTVLSTKAVGKTVMPMVKASSNTQTATYMKESGKGQ